ncbi:MAG TPA: carboxyl transferase domain-containing protein [Methylomirabilota bacterium]|jgi:acetyl-CoA carboxylase carboxyltransferase component|nr:carboxyl transferase domain-containing protein [Methylomirabilota bacterium]
MGGLDKIEAQYRRRRLTTRERVPALLDPGSFIEFGALAHSERDEVADHSPGDGKIIGFGAINGRKVGVGADDVTVFHTGSSYIGVKKVDHLGNMCFKHGFPFIFLGECGGARIPDLMISRGLPRFGVSLDLVKRNRGVPMITAILGESFGGSAWYAAGQFHVDDVSDPRATRSMILQLLEYTCGDRFPKPVAERPLLSWPLRL